MSKSANKILVTAENLFNQQNFTSVGVDLIRDQSGCSKTTMYTYFKNKQQLISEVLKQRDLRFRESLINAIGDTAGYEALQRIYDWHMNWFQTDQFKGCLFVRAVADITESNIEITSISIAHKVWLRQLIIQYSQEVSSQNELGEVIYTLLEGLISRFLVEGFDLKVAQQQWWIISNLIKNKNL